MPKQNCCLSPAIVEALQDYVTNYHKARRLHLIVVDLWRPWKYNTALAREIADQLWRISDCDDTRRVSPLQARGSHYGAADLLKVMLWMALNVHVTSCGLKEIGNLIVCWVPLDPWACTSMTPLHFSQICVRREALTLFGLKDDELLPDLHITRAGVLRIELGRIEGILHIPLSKHCAQRYGRMKQIVAFLIGTATAKGPFAAGLYLGSAQGEGVEGVVGMQP